MALSAATVFEVRTDGSDTNGGGFVPGSGGVDYSQQASAQLSVTDAACAGTTTLTSATGGFTSAMVGNLVYLSSGPGWYQIAAYTNTNTVTIDRNGPNATGMTARVGGALASPGSLGLVFNAHGVSGQKAWIRGGTYVMTSTTANVSGGRLSIKPSTAFVLCGYGTTRGDGTRPVLDAGSLTSFTMITTDGTFNEQVVVADIECNAKGNSTVTAFSCTDYTTLYRTIARSATTGFTGSATCVGTQAISCTTGYNNVTGARVVRCIAIGCTTGFTNQNNATISGCVAVSCTTGFDSGFNAAVHRCTAYGGTDGFRTSSGSHNMLYVNCLAVGCSGFGFNTAADDQMFYCAGYNNTSGNKNATPIYEDTFIALTADPFVNAAGSDFRLNNTAGGGALLRGSAMPFPTQTTSDDIGALQSTNGGASGFSLSRLINLGG